jgi:hypothetical protein
MKKKLIVALIALAPFAASAQSAIINSWSDPNTANQNLAIHKVVIAALIYNQAVRRPGGTVPLFEDVSNAIHAQLSTDGIIQ